MEKKSEARKSILIFMEEKTIFLSCWRLTGKPVLTTIQPPEGNKPQDKPNAELKRKKWGKFWPLLLTLSFWINQLRRLDLEVYRLQ
jgi:hypothetical protein